VYLQRLAARVVGEGLAGQVLVMRSSGGLMAVAEAARLAAAILLSGPAGGVVAAAALGESLGHRRLVSFDMGGTSTDVCRIEDGRPEVAYERAVDGYPCRLPSVAVHTVGAGGGSVGWRDAGGSLRVGPRSAGAEPGPACYGRGGSEPTVTDADLVLGRLDPKGRLAGAVPLDLEAARSALAPLGGALGLDIGEAALGMGSVVEARMERAVRAVSVEEGADPRQAVLAAFGGAGGLHATALARRLEMSGVVIPPYAGVFSAVGMLLSPPRADAARSVLVGAGESDRLGPAVEEVRHEAAGGLRDQTGSHPAGLRSVADVRYVGQAHETPVDHSPGEGWEALGERFHAAHRERNGFARPGDPIEVVTVRAEAVGTPALRWQDLPEHRPSGEPRRGARSVLTSGGEVRATVWWRPGLAPGREIRGPAVIEEGEATTWLGRGEAAVVHPSGALEVRW
ncbi:MAG: hydantoinase/oxoprolinase family protein, partial [Acidimicrobiia bacterium]